MTEKKKDRERSLPWGYIKVISWRKERLRRSEIWMVTLLSGLRRIFREIVARTSERDGWAGPVRPVERTVNQTANVYGGFWGMLNKQLTANKASCTPQDATREKIGLSRARLQIRIVSTNSYVLSFACGSIRIAFYALVAFKHTVFVYRRTNFNSKFNAGRKI